jgi:hypothetical protein
LLRRFITRDPLVSFIIFKTKAQNRRPGPDLLPSSFFYNESTRSMTLMRGSRG